MKVVEATADRLVMQYQSQGAGRFWFYAMLPLAIGSSVSIVDGLIEADYKNSIGMFLGFCVVTAFLLLSFFEKRTLSEFTLDKSTGNLTIRKIRFGRMSEKTYPLAEMRLVEVVRADREDSEEHILTFQYAPEARREDVKFPNRWGPFIDGDNAVELMNGFLTDWPKCRSSNIETRSFIWGPSPKVAETDKQHSNP